MTIDSNMNGKYFLDGFSTALTRLTSRWLEQLFGPGMNDIAFGSVTWLDLGVMLCFVLLVLLLNGVAAGYVRHKLKKAAAAPEEKKLHHTSVYAVSSVLHPSVDSAPRIIANLPNFELETGK
ncbi:MAG: hypothetical protein WAO76_09260 [Georgfuchsia sp.]